MTRKQQQTGQQQRGQQQRGTRRALPKALSRAGALVAVLPGVLLGVLSGLTPLPAAAGGVSGQATEWTQLANNAELIAILGKETEGVALEARQLLTQAEQLRTQFLAYRNMIRNTLNLPETIWGDVEGSLTGLRAVMAQAQVLAGDGAALDRFLRTRMITDPLYQAAPIAKEEYAARYDDWSDVTGAALNAALGAARLTVEDVDSEARLLSRIAAQGRTANGQVEAIQIGNELSNSIARQLAHLRTLTAAQTEQTSLFQARWMAAQDADEAARRATARRAEEIGRSRSPGRNLIGTFTRGRRQP